MELCNLALHKFKINLFNRYNLCIIVFDIKKTIISLIMDGIRIEDNGNGSITVYGVSLLTSMLFLWEDPLRISELLETKGINPDEGYVVLLAVRPNSSGTYHLYLGEDE